MAHSDLGSILRLRRTSVLLWAVAGSTALLTACSPAGQAGAGERAGSGKGEDPAECQIILDEWGAREQTQGSLTPADEEAVLAQLQAAGCTEALSRVNGANAGPTSATLQQFNEAIRVAFDGTARGLQISPGRQGCVNIEFSDSTGRIVARGCPTEQGFSRIAGFVDLETAGTGAATLGAGSTGLPVPSFDQLRANVLRSLSTSLGPLVTDRIDAVDLGDELSPALVDLSGALNSATLNLGAQFGTAGGGAGGTSPGDSLAELRAALDNLRTGGASGSLAPDPSFAERIDTCLAPTILTSSWILDSFEAVFADWSRLEQNLQSIGTSGGFMLAPFETTSPGRFGAEFASMAQSYAAGLSARPAGTEPEDPTLAPLNPTGGSEPSPATFEDGQLILNLIRGDLPDGCRLSQAPSDDGLEDV